MMDNTQKRISDETIPNRRDADLPPGDVHHAPWILQRHFDGEIDLDRELNARFYAMPVLSTIKTNRLDARHATAMMTTQDGAAALRVDVDLNENLTDLVFSLRSMLAFKFTLTALGDNHRARWLDLMQHTTGRPAFLWGPTRWDSDYLITVSHQYYTNLYAFSSQHFEAGARMTPDVKNQLLDWLKALWQPVSSEDTGPILTTW
jgi:hypothetical protein